MLGISPLTAADIAILRQSNSPWPHAQQDWHGGLRVTFYAQPHNRAQTTLKPNQPYYSIEDSSGYLCATHSESTLLACLHLESQSSGSLRELITGESSIESQSRSMEHEHRAFRIPKPTSLPATLSLADLDIKL